MNEGPLEVSDNERVILDLIRREEPIRRSAIHGAVPLSQPSVHRILDGLIGRGLVEVGRATANGPGKPSPEILLDRRHHYSVGISVNTDALTICLANLACEPVHQVSFEGRSSDRVAALTLIHAETRRMLSAADATEEQLVGICLAVSGFFLSPSTMNPPEPLLDWGLIDLHAELARHFTTATYIENNATTGAIGESLIGIGRWSNNFAYLSFNYGFGGGAIIDGRPYLGANGNALEISGMYSEQESAGRPALASLIEHLNRHGHEITTVEELRSRFDPNWNGVESWVEATLPALNRALWAIRAILDPEVIVFGGEIPQALAEMFIERASLYGTDTHRYGQAMPAPELLYTQAAEVGASLGAALVPLKARLFR
jgi:predicted NBD/HSP70 family sugar kinase